MKIHKVLVSQDRKGHEIRLGNNARVHSVGVQDGQIVAWYSFEPHPDTALDQRWNFVAVWTGQEFIPYGDFVGTVTVDELVYHVYAGRL